MRETDDFTSGEIASAADAAAAVASPAQHTEPTTEQADPSTRATAAAAQTATPDERYKGWIPGDAHERVVDGFHKRLDAVSWASGLNPDDVREALAIRRQLNERATTSHEPQPDVKDERGDPFYSPQQAARWAAWQAEQMVSEKMQAIEKRIGPIESTFAETRQTNELMGQIDHAIAWPGFADHIEEIRAAIATATSQRRTLSLEQAYIQVVAPTLAETNATREAALKKTWLAELNTTHNLVKDEVNPGRSPSGSRKKDSEMSIGELVQDEVSKRRKAS